MAHYDINITAPTVFSDWIAANKQSLRTGDSIEVTFDTSNGTLLQNARSLLSTGYFTTPGFEGLSTFTINTYSTYDSFQDPGKPYETSYTFNLHMYFGSLNPEKVIFKGKSNRVFDFGQYNFGNRCKLFDLSQFSHTELESPFERDLCYTTTSSVFEIKLNPNATRKATALDMTFYGAGTNGSRISNIESLLREYEWYNVKSFKSAFENSVSIKNLYFPTLRTYLAEDWCDRMMDSSAIENIFNMPADGPIRNCPPTIKSISFQTSESFSFSSFYAYFDAFSQSPEIALDVSGCKSVTSHFSDGSNEEYFPKMNISSMIIGENTIFDAWNGNLIREQFKHITWPNGINIAIRATGKKTFEELKQTLTTSWRELGLPSQPTNITQAPLYLFKRTDGASGININNYIFRRS